MKCIDNEKGLNNQLIETKGFLLVNFWSDWSLQCRNMYHAMCNIKYQLREEDAIAYIDWSQNKELSKNLEVYGVPTLIIFFDGKERVRLSGMISERALLKHIEHRY